MPYALDRLARDLPRDLSQDFDTIAEEIKQLAQRRIIEQKGVRALSRSTIRKKDRRGSPHPERALIETGGYLDSIRVYVETAGKTKGIAAEVLWTIRPSDDPVKVPPGKHKNNVGRFRGTYLDLAVLLENGDGGRIPPIPFWRNFEDYIAGRVVKRRFFTKKFDYRLRRFMRQYPLGAM